MKLKLNNVRVAFTQSLFNAEAYGEGEKKFGCNFIIEKGSENDKAIRDAIETLAKTTWGAKAQTVLNSIRTNPMRYCYRDGDTVEWDGHPGNMFIRAANKVRPLIVDADKTPLVEADGKPYGGCYVNAVITLYCYDNNGKGIGASLGGVQFAKDGDAFTGGRAATADDFDDIAEGATASDLV